MHYSKKIGFFVLICIPTGICAMAKSLEEENRIDVLPGYCVRSPEEILKYNLNGDKCEFTLYALDKVPNIAENLNPLIGKYISLVFPQFFIPRGMHVYYVARQKTEDATSSDILCPVTTYAFQILVDFTSLLTLYKWEPSRAFGLITDITAWIAQNHDQVRSLVTNKQKLIDAFNQRPVISLKHSGANHLSLSLCAAEKIPFLESACAFAGKQGHTPYCILDTCSPFTIFVFRELVHLLNFQDEMLKADNRTSSIIKICNLIEHLCEVCEHEELIVTELIELAMQWNLPSIAHAVIRLLQKQNNSEVIEQFCQQLSVPIIKILLKNVLNSGFIIKCLIAKLYKEPSSFTTSELTEIAVSFAEVLPLIVSKSIKQDKEDELADIQSDRPSSFPTYVLGNKVRALLANPVCIKLLNPLLKDSLETNYCFRTQDNLTIIVRRPNFIRAKDVLRNCFLVEPSLIILNTQETDGDGQFVITLDYHTLLAKNTKGRAKPCDSGHIMIFEGDDKISILALETQELKQLSTFKDSHSWRWAALDENRFVRASYAGVDVIDSKGNLIQQLDRGCPGEPSVLVEQGVIQVLYEKDNQNIVRVWDAKSYKFLHADAYEDDARNKGFLYKLFFYKDLIITIKGRYVIIKKIMDDAFTSKENAINNSCSFVLEEFEEVVDACLIAENAELDLAIALPGGIIHRWDIRSGCRKKTLLTRKGTIALLHYLAPALRVVYQDSTMDAYILSDNEPKDLTFEAMVKQMSHET